jgi:hypothetical protein
MVQMRKKLRSIDGIRMEYVKRYPDSTLTKSNVEVKIFSSQWGYYWRKTGQGYTPNPHESQTYTIAEAFAKTKHCGPEKKIWFIYVDRATKVLDNVTVA